jgi:uncharacterized membrane protein YphA (DoxX/SURF4 family)
MKKNIISWVAQVIVVIILGQTLLFKFTDAPETVALFKELRMGAFGYKLIGTLELIACVMLLIPSSVAWGALLAWGVMSGAILAHLTKIGFNGELGMMGGMAIIAWLLCTVIMFIRRDQVPFFSSMFKKGGSDLHS